MVYVIIASAVITGALWQQGDIMGNPLTIKDMERLLKKLKPEHRSEVRDGVMTTSKFNFRELGEHATEYHPLTVKSRAGVVYGLWVLEHVDNTTKKFMARLTRVGDTFIPEKELPMVCLSNEGGYISFRLSSKQS